MSVNDPKHIYGTIAQGFLKETVPARDAPALLDHLFVDAPIPSKKKKASAANAPSKTMQ